MKNAVLTIVAIAVVGSVAYLLIAGQDNNDKSSEQSETQDMVQDNQDNETAVDNNDIESDDSTDTEEGMSAGIYTAYDSSLLANAEEGDVVLFFKASWCPTCNALDANIQANLDEIPSSLSILTLDYDTENELKDKYDIRTQHTLVQVDEFGNEINKWVGSFTINEIVNQVT
jgi:thiol-disulfide isomerase/thioredoxin